MTWRWSRTTGDANAGRCNRASVAPTRTTRDTKATSSRELLRIHTGVPIDYDVASFRYRGPSRDTCYTLFSELGFRSLVTEFAPTADTTARDYRLVTDLASLRAVASEIRAAGRFGVRVIADSPIPNCLPPATATAITR